MRGQQALVVHAGIRESTTAGRASRGSGGRNGGRVAPGLAAKAFGLALDGRVDGRLVAGRGRPAQHGAVGVEGHDQERGRSAAVEVLPERGSFVGDGGPAASTASTSSCVDSPWPPGRSSGTGCLRAA